MSVCSPPDLDEARGSTAAMATAGKRRPESFVIPAITDAIAVAVKLTSARSRPIPRVAAASPSTAANAIGTFVKVRTLDCSRLSMSEGPSPWMRLSTWAPTWVQSPGPLIQSAIAMSPRTPGTRSPNRTSILCESEILAVSLKATIDPITSATKPPKSAPRKGSISRDTANMRMPNAATPACARLHPNRTHVHTATVMTIVPARRPAKAAFPSP